MKRMILIVSLGSFLCIASISAINLYISRSTRHSIYEQDQTIPGAYTALILGAKVYSNGWLSHMLEDRVLTGVELYRRGNVQKLLLSGDHGQKDYDEVNGHAGLFARTGHPG